MLLVFVQKVTQLTNSYGSDSKQSILIQNNFSAKSHSTYQQLWFLLIQNNQHVSRR
jgi:hypothetical protein